MSAISAKHEGHFIALLSEQKPKFTFFGPELQQHYCPDLMYTVQMNVVKSVLVFDTQESPTSHCSVRTICLFVEQETFDPYRASVGVYS